MNKLIPALALSAVLLAGCGKEETPIPTMTLPGETAPEAVTEVTGETRFTQPAETVPDPTEETVELSYTAYRVTYNHMQENYEEYCTFQGIDPEGNIVWTKESAHLDMTELQRITPIGVWEDRFLYSESGTVVALDVVTGEELFRSADSCGAGNSYLLDPAGFLYICGYHGPDLLVLDMEGNTVNKIDQFNPDHYWAFDIQQEGNELVISLEGDGTGSGEIHTYRVEMDWLPQPQG